jgi:TetR/AcrR family transcriptional repressor of nem operon
MKIKEFGDSNLGTESGSNFTKQTFGKLNSFVIFVRTQMPIQKVDRKSIIKSALTVFKEKGYHNTSMADLAAACGLMKGSFYHYFPSKQALMQEILTALKDHYTDKVFSIAYNDDLKPESRVKELAKQSEEIFMEEKGGCFMVSIGLETIHVVDDFTATIKDFFGEWIKAMKYLYAFYLSEKEAKLQAEVTVAEVEGAVMLMQLMGDKQYLTRTNKKLVMEYEKLSKITVE